MVNSYKCSTPAFGGTVNEELIKDAFIGVSKKKIIDEAGGAVSYVDAFVGKASPETFERVLALVYQYREAFVSAYGKTHTEPYKTCAKILSGDGRPSESCRPSAMSIWDSTATASSETSSPRRITPSN